MVHGMVHLLPLCSIKCQKMNHRFTQTLEVRYTTFARRHCNQPKQT